MIDQECMVLDIMDIVFAATHERKAKIMDNFQQETEVRKGSAKAENNERQKTLRAIYSDAAIFSACRSEFTSEENWDATDRLVGELTMCEIPIHSRFGRFEGVYKHSFIVCGKVYVQIAKTLALEAAQVSVLLLASPEMNGKRQAAFWNCADNTIEPAGWLVNVGSETPPGDYTLDPDSGA